MLGNIRDVTTVIVTGIIMLVMLLVFFMLTLKGSELSTETFKTGSENFSACNATLQDNSKLYKNYNNTDVIKMNVTELTKMREQLDIEETCNTDYVLSSDEQIADYAKNVFEYSTSKYSKQNMALLDTVYTAPAKYYAYLNEPQDYLFFAMSEDESIMMAFVYKPLDNDYEITELWTIDEGSDLDIVQQYVNNILAKYYEKVI